MWKRMLYCLNIIKVGIMMATGATGGGTTTASQIELLLIAAEKRQKGSLIPVPARLRPKAAVLSSTASFAMPAASSRGSTTTPAATAAREAVVLHSASVVGTQSAAHLEWQAASRCLSRVPGLEPWLHRLRHVACSCADLDSFVRRLRSLLDQLIAITANVRGQSEHLSANASALMARRAHLERLHAGVSRTLDTFTTIDELFKEVSHPLLNPARGRFCDILDQMEDAAACLAQLTKFKSTPTYAARLALAYQRALVTLRDAVIQVFQGAREAQQQQAPVDAGAGATVPHSILDVEGAAFRTLVALANKTFAERLDAHRGIIGLLEARWAHKGAEGYVNDAILAFTECRYAVLRPVLHARFITVTAACSSRPALPVVPPPMAGGKTPSLPPVVLVDPARFTETMIRDSVELVAEEQLLCEGLWSAPDVSRQLVASLASELLEVQYNAFRSKLLTIDDILQLGAICPAASKRLQVAPPPVSWWLPWILRHPHPGRRKPAFHSASTSRITERGTPLEHLLLVHGTSFDDDSRSTSVPGGDVAFPGGR